MANKQTAVEWLEEKLNKYNNLLMIKEWKIIIEQAKAMEKEQICNAWDDAYDKGTRDRLEKISNPVGNAEQYHKKKFKSE